MQTSNLYSLNITTLKKHIDDLLDKKKYSQVHETFLSTIRESLRDSCQLPNRPTLSSIKGLLDHCRDVMVDVDRLLIGACKRMPKSSSNVAYENYGTIRSEMCNLMDAPRHARPVSKRLAWS